MSDDEATPGSSPQSSRDPQQAAHKRKASQAGLEGSAQARAVKRRASKACQCCRARKVRCNVTEHGAPCTNCRLDEVECIVSESRRKKKLHKDGVEQPQPEVAAKLTARKLVSRSSATDGFCLQQPPQNAFRSHDLSTSIGEHVPHSIYQTTGQRLSLQSFARRTSFGSMATGSPYPILHHSPMSTESIAMFAPRIPGIENLPYFIKPLPSRMGPEEIEFLEKKGALSVPANTLRNELLRAYIEFVHPYMPLIDLYDFVMIIESGNGSLGRISLILFQAVMFAGSAFVDMHHLVNAGYASRKDARKDFFQKTRLLYDFDYESDRVSLVQALLLLTYYYETPDDQKDTWHWMGVATSVAHTIGLHRDPERSNMTSKKTKLWKRIWWSTYMRDRLIALGMRRPTRIKSEDYDVPMLTLNDFDFVAIPDSVTCVPADCWVARDVVKQRQLAQMCIEKSKLCLCISHVLSKQYCVLNNNQGMVNDRTTMMLLPKKLDPATCEVKACDDELEQWLNNLHEDARQREHLTGDRAIDLNRSLLHMVFFTTLSALHRPQVLPSSPITAPSTKDSVELLERSRRNVRRAANAITDLAQQLDQRDLVRFLPTTGVTVLLPAIIIHLLDIKAPDEATRRASLKGFCQCMQVMGKLRDLYAAADYSTAFLEAAIRKAGIHMTPFPNGASLGASATVAPSHTQHKQGSPISSVEDLVDAGRRMELAAATMAPPPPHTLTPPPDPDFTASSAAKSVTDDEVARRLETFLASTPPDSDAYLSSEGSDFAPALLLHKADAAMFGTVVLPAEFDTDDFDALLNFDAMAAGPADAGAWNFDDAVAGAAPEPLDVDWLGGGGGDMEERSRFEEEEISGISVAA